MNGVRWREASAGRWLPRVTNTARSVVDVHIERVQWLTQV